MAATYYFVWGECGSLTLYYKTGTPKAARVTLGPEQVAASRAEGTAPELACLLYLSDAFGEAIKRESSQMLLDDGAPPPRRYLGRGEIMRLRAFESGTATCSSCETDPCICGFLQ